MQPVAQLFPKHSALFMSGLRSISSDGVVYAVLVEIAKKTSEEGRLTPAYASASSRERLGVCSFWRFGRCRNRRALLAEGVKRDGE